MLLIVFGKCLCGRLFHANGHRDSGFEEMLVEQRGLLGLSLFCFSCVCRREKSLAHLQFAHRQLTSVIVKMRVMDKVELAQVVSLCGVRVHRLEHLRNHLQIVIAQLLRLVELALGQGLRPLVDRLHRVLLKPLCPVFSLVVKQLIPQQFFAALRLHIDCVVVG